MKRRRTVNVCVNGIELEVEGTFYPGRRAVVGFEAEESRAGEASAFEVEGVWIGGEDVFPLIEECGELVENVAEAARGAEEEREADRDAEKADEWYRKMKDEGYDTY